MGTATLGGRRFRLDPTRVSWSYAVKTSERDTLGGRVVQVYGADISDISVLVTFGAGGWREQEAWFRGLVAQADAQARGTLEPLQFRYPHLGVDFRCYLKAVDQAEGDSITLANEIIAPAWNLTLVPIEDDKGTLAALKEASIIGYLERLADGVGWKQTSYNGPLTREELLSVMKGDSDAAAQLFLATAAEPVAAAAFAALASSAASLAQGTGPGSTGSQAPSGGVGGDPGTIVPTGGVAAPTAGSLTMTQLIDVARQAGFTGMNLAIAGGVALAESTLNPRAHNPNPPDNSYGLFQINMIGSLGPARRRQFGLSNNEQLFDPLVNAKAAYRIAGNGTSWRPWSTFTNGSYKIGLPEARRIVGV